MPEKSVPLCPDCEYYPLCRKHSSDLSQTHCSQIFHTLSEWQKENNFQTVNEDTFCLLLNIGNKKEKLVPKVCAQCGKPFMAKNPMREFCSISCKLNYEREARRRGIVCQTCGKPLKSLSSAFCSIECRAKFVTDMFKKKAKILSPLQPYLFGSWLQEVVEQVGLTKNSLAKRLNISPAAIAKWATGVCSPPRKFVIEMANIFNIDVCKLECLIIDDDIIRKVKEDMQRE